jgi:cytochrome c oxidase cbb3-type subunit I
MANASVTPSRCGPDSTARLFLISGVLWGLVGASFGLLSALALIAPDLISNGPHTSFGRMRPVHVNTVALGFVYSLLLAGVAHIVPRLCRVEGLWSERLGRLSAWIWNLTILSGAVTLLLGMTQARELAEYIWPVDVLLAVSIALLTFNVYMTVLSRKERLLYVSLWYICGGLIWTILVYAIGNVMWKPMEGSLTGTLDQIWMWFYGHNVVGLILTPLATAMAYYVIPRAVGRPVWSHNLSLMGFWILLVIYTHVGTHHIIQAPVPRWLKIISIVDSIALMIPVSCVLLNLWLPIRGRWGVLHENIGAKWVFMGTIWYALTCFQGPMHSLPSVQRVTHFTHWVVAHAHIAILGFAGFIGIGMAYTMLPRIAKRPIYSRRMADLQYWLMLAGLTIMFIDLTIAGLVQGNQWLNGEAFYNVIRQLPIYLIIRAVSGVLILSGLVLMAVNVLATLWGRAPSHADAPEIGGAEVTS